jgi:hypothetical protein
MSYVCIGLGLGVRLRKLRFLVDMFAELLRAEGCEPSAFSLQRCSLQFAVCSGTKTKTIILYYNVKCKITYNIIHRVPPYTGGTW